MICCSYTITCSNEKRCFSLQWNENVSLEKKVVLKVLNVFKKCFKGIIFTFDFSCCSRTKEIIMPVTLANRFWHENNNFYF